MVIKESSLILKMKMQKNIHPIKISPLKIEGALKLIVTKYGPKAEPLFSKRKVSTILSCH